MGCERLFPHLTLRLLAGGFLSPIPNDSHLILSHVGAAQRGRLQDLRREHRSFVNA
jgi:hypothetical protein